MMTYSAFLETKAQKASVGGFAPIWMPDFLFPFQRSLVDWALRKGRAAIFADCGLGKTPMQLVWAENVVRQTNGRVLILTPLAVGMQTVEEGEKFGIACHRSRNGALTGPIIVANYEQLHRFTASDFVGVVCDESSILKHFAGATQKAVTRFMAKLPYRLLCTATAAPNDYIELGTSAEALGEMGYSDMLSRFFRQDDKKRYRMNDVKAAREANHNYYAKLLYRIAQQIGQWRLKGHAEMAFWRWVASWARACRSPADLGYPDQGFILPSLEERHHLIMATRPREGMLFTLPACGLGEEREERRRTLQERCESVAALVDHRHAAIVWCHTNAEGNLLAQLIAGAIQVAGLTQEEAREEAYTGFAHGAIRVLIIKPKIGAWGMNWQHCAHVVTFASHSYEQYYQSIRRCWRFGQTQAVMVDIVATEGERYVLDNMTRKAQAMDAMFSRLVGCMHDAIGQTRSAATLIPEVPKWLSPNNY